MSKTIREYLEELPEPYRTEAIEQTDDPEYKGIGLTNFKTALKMAFDWQESKQGFKYWYNVLIEDIESEKLLYEAKQILNK